jgi:hypothetical protein
VFGRLFEGRRTAMRIERWIRASLGLGVLALLAVLTSHLALTDIYHGEGDLSLEWSVLRVSFGVIVGSQIATLITLTKVLRRNAQTGAA